jgi:NAD(P)-dependent dehydrogenase (short-subunit alcohol dehydrogenase family)
MSNRIAGKVVLISGTGGGQGRAAARLFASEGATVVGTDIDSAAAEETVRLVSNDGFKMTSFAPLDLSTPEGAQAWVRAAVDAHGGIDALYNNAGGVRFVPFAQMSPEDYQFTVHNELDLVWYCTQAAWPHLVARGGGTVLNVGSIAAIAGSRDLPQAAHSATKGAVIALTRQLAAEGAAVKIRVNSISPGVTAVPAVVALLDSNPELLMHSINHAYNLRAGRPEEIVAAALFLISDEASYISGSNLVVDGGTTTLF